MAAGAKQVTKEDTTEMAGIVTGIDRGSARVTLENGHEVRAVISGHMMRHRIRIFTGDKVKVELTSYNLTKGRIIYRFNRL